MNDNMLVKVYSGLLRLYPQRFYREHAGDMETVFAMTIHAAHQENTFNLAKVCFHELLSLPLAVIRQYWHERLRITPPHKEFSMIARTTPSQIRFVRWLTRLFGLVATLFFLSAILHYLPTNPQEIPLTIFLVATLASILLAWRLERIGGIATMICAACIALAGMYATYSYSHTITFVPFWIVLLAGVLWGFPFMAVGWLFIKLSQAAELTPAQN